MSQVKKQPRSAVISLRLNEERRALLARYRHVLADQRGLGLIRFRGHFPKGGYDVHNGRQTAQAYASEFQ